MQKPETMFRAFVWFKGSKVQRFKGGVDLAERNFAVSLIQESQMDYTRWVGKLEGGEKVKKCKGET